MSDIQTCFELSEEKSKLTTEEAQLAWFFLFLGFPEGNVAVLSFSFSNSSPKRMSLSDQCLGVTEEGGVYEKRSNGVVLTSQLYHSLAHVLQLSCNRNCITQWPMYYNCNTCWPMYRNSPVISIVPWEKPHISTHGTTNLFVSDTF